MAKTDKKVEGKVVLQRTYIVPLRAGWLKVPHHRRGNKAIKTLREFMLQHMKVYDRDLRKIKIDRYLNNEMRFRGIRKPPAKIKVTANKFDDGHVLVSLAELPVIVQFKKSREEKRSLRIKKSGKKETKEDDKKTDEKKSDDTKREEIKEKEEAAKEQTQLIAKKQANEAKHASKISEPKIHRVALKK